MSSFDFEYKVDIAWCPGCGNFSIRKALLAALQELDCDPLKTVMVSGIGQAAKMPQYINSHMFNGLHGRGLPAAVAIKACHPELTVIAEGGDGDMYGEGGNHFIHNIRRNPDIAHIVHNNMIYGLTKGQGSPTSEVGFVTNVQVDGVINEPFNPLAVAITLGATFVARAFSGDVKQLTSILKAAIAHKGYALVDVFQPCVTFNKVNTYAWYKQHTYTIDEKYDATDFDLAYKKTMEKDQYPLGILYQKEHVKTFEEKLNIYQQDKKAVIFRKRDIKKVNKLINI